MNRSIINPTWANEEKTAVLCIFEYDDHTANTVSISETKDGEPDNPDWKELFETYNEEDIGDYVGFSTEEIINGDLLSIKHRLDSLENSGIPIKPPEPKESPKDLNEILFKTKLEAFEIEEVKNSKNRNLKSKIRKSKTLMEVNAYTIALIVDEINSQ